MQVPDLGVNRSHIGQIVDTVGWVTPVWCADERRVHWTTGRTKDEMLPPGLRFALQDIDERNRAILYRDDTGVLMVPAHLVDPWSR